MGFVASIRQKGKGGGHFGNVRVHGTLHILAIVFSAKAI